MSNNLIPFLWLRQESHQQIFAEITKMKEWGINSFCVESRPFYPERVAEGKPDCDFNSNGWFERVDYILNLAKQLDMKVWMFDEKGFPTGICNDKIAEFPHLKARQIICRFVDFASQGQQVSVMSSLDVLSGDKLLGAFVFPLTDNSVSLDQCVEINAKPDDTMISFYAEKGIWRVAFLIDTNRCGEFDNYMDMLNPESVDLLIDEVYEKNYEHFSKFFGNTFVGFFSDEPRFGNGYFNWKISGSPDEFNNVLGLIGGAYPFSDQVFDLLIEKGYASKDFLSLFLFAENKSESFRCDYADLITSLYKKNFNEKISDWCHKRNVMYSLHIIEDMGAHCRFGCGAGHYFKAMDGVDIAGVDIVLHSIKPYLNNTKFLNPVGIADPLFYKNTLAKLASSSAALDKQKKGRALCEIFGAYGFGETIKQMVYLVNHMVVMGINTFIPHAFSMDFPDIDCPPHFFADGQIAYHEGYKLLFGYMNKLCDLFKNGFRKTDVAVLYHAELEWSGKSYLSMDNIAKVLHENQIDFNFVPYYKLQSIKNYKVLLVPDADFYPDFVLEAISALNIDKIFVNKDVSLKNLPNFLFCHYIDKVLSKNSRNLRILNYFQNNINNILLFNDGMSEIRNSIYLNENYKVMDLLNNSQYKAIIQNGKFNFILLPGQAIVLQNKNAEIKKHYKFYKCIKDFFVMQKEYDENEFKPFSGFDKNFSGFIKYSFVADFTNVKKIKVDYNGEFCKLIIDNKSFISIDSAEFFINIQGSKKAEVVVCNTFANKFKDRFSAFSSVSGCRVNNVKLFK